MERNWAREGRAAFGLDPHAPAAAAMWQQLRSPILIPALSGIAVVIVLHVVHPLRFSLEIDRGPAEFLGYGLAILAIAGLAQLAAILPGGRHVLGGAAGLFVYVLVDDMLRVHEEAGGLIAREAGLGTMGGLAGPEVGQLLFFTGIGLVTAIGGGLLYRGASEPARIVVHWVGLGIAALGVFGVFIDAVHEALSPPSWDPDLAWVAVEDGGEMVALALVASYVFARVSRETSTADDRHVVVDLRSEPNDRPLEVGRGSG